MSFIKKIRIKNFKNLEDVEIEVKPLTFLFGPNGSGKSSFIKAMMFLSKNLFPLNTGKTIFKIIDDVDLGSYRIREYEISNSNNSDIEFFIAKKSIDKLFFDSNLTLKDINQKRKNDYEIEFHNSESLICPECYQRLKNVPSTIKLEKDKIYDWKTILHPFLRNAKNIEIKDPYLSNYTAI